MKSEQGHTVAKLVWSTVIVGIVAAVALPNLERLIATANAAVISYDARTLSTKISDYYLLNARLPSTTDWGEGPPELGYDSGPGSFGQADTEYRLVSDSVTGQVALWVGYADGSLTGAALVSFRRSGHDVGSVSWTRTQTTFRLFASQSSNGEGEGA